MSYKYTVYTPDKKVVRGTLDVASEGLAESALYRAGYERVLTLREVKAGLTMEKLLPSLFGIKMREVVDFASQLSTLVDSGISLLTALELLAGQASRAPFKRIIAGLAGEIREGGTLSQAMTKYPKVFPDTYIQLIRASEQAGTLGAGLKHAAVYTEKQEAANQKVKRAMAYPAFVLLMAAGVSVLLITVALPPLVNLFASLGAKLPWTTRSLIAITGFLLQNKLYVLAVIVLIIVTFAVSLRFPSMKAARDELVLKIPIIGSIIIESSMQHLCQTASMLLQAGLRLPLTMDIIIQANGNTVIRRALEKVREMLVQGEGLSRPMSEIPLFPPLLAEMTAVGEKSGALDTTLGALADYYEKKADRSTDTLISMIEPALTVLVGVVVIFIALSVITPLYSILRSMR